VPQRIAIISSKYAAGYSDFINHLTGNSFGYVFHTSLIDTAMQGTETEQGVILALNKIADYSDFFDLVVIIRGGGSQTDLSWFDNYNIAYHVTQFPIPVLTGIGHDKDMSVTDMVAYKSLKTPTAVADYIVDCVAEAENHIIELSSAITDISRSIIEGNRIRIEESRIKLIPLSRLMISEIKDDLTGKIIEIINFGKEYIVRSGLAPENQKSRLRSSVKSCLNGRKVVIERNIQDLIVLTNNTLNRNIIKLAGLETNLSILSPDNVLRRGYTITTYNGRIIKKSDQIQMGDIIDTQFSDGEVKSKVVEKTKDKSKKTKGVVL
jgi:exodeoxyribonuclease VII large subunit